MAARITQWTPDIVRQRIKTSHIVRVLQEHLFDGLELSTTQLRAAEILLRKTLPDQTAVAHSGTIESKPEELNDAVLAHIAISGSDRAIKAPSGKEEPSGIH